MGSEWDYKLWKAQMAWDLAMRIIPSKVEPQGSWTEENYLGNIQTVLKKAQSVVDAVFTADKPTS